MIDCATFVVHDYDTGFSEYRDITLSDHVYITQIVMDFDKIGIQVLFVSMTSEDHINYMELMMIVLVFFPLQRRIVTYLHGQGSFRSVARDGCFPPCRMLWLMLNMACL